MSLASDVLRISKSCSKIEKVIQQIVFFEKEDPLINNNFVTTVQYSTFIVGSNMISHEINVC
jgi:hypothetical protein